MKNYQSEHKFTNIHQSSSQILQTSSSKAPPPTATSWPSSPQQLHLNSLTAVTPCTALLSCYIRNLLRRSTTATEIKLCRTRKWPRLHFGGTDQPAKAAFEEQHHRAGIRRDRPSSSTVSLLYLHFNLEPGRTNGSSSSSHPRGRRRNCDARETTTCSIFITLLHFIYKICTISSWHCKGWNSFGKFRRS